MSEERIHIALEGLKVGGADAWLAGENPGQISCSALVPVAECGIVQGTLVGDP